MTPEQFRQHGHEVVDWIADYWSRVGTLPGAVAGRARRRPGRAARRRRPSRASRSPPCSPTSTASSCPGVTHWQHPGFFGYFPANTSGPSVLGDLVSAGLGVQGMSWVTSPAATELEQHVMDWLADLLGLPASFRSTGTGGGVVQDSSSGANLVALLAALHRASGGRHRRGTASTPTGPPSTSRPRRTPRWRRPSGSPASAPTPSASSRSTTTWPCGPARSPPGSSATSPAGYTPVLVCATVGTTSTTAIDPLAELGPICQKYGVWLHVDAAYAGVSAVVPELRALQDGVEWADSYTTDAHKWLLTGFDATLFWVADRAALTGALSILPEYLRNAATDAGAVVDFRDWQIPLGRRFRALKLWFVLRWYGAEGLRAHIRSHVALAQELAGWADADERFDVATAAPALAGLPAAALGRRRGRRRRHHDAAGAAQRRRRGVPDPHHRRAARPCCGWPSARPTTTRAHVERVWTLLREGHDWLAADFAAAAAERAAEQDRAAAGSRAERAEAAERRRGPRGRPRRRRRRPTAPRPTPPAVEASVGE